MDNGARKFVKNANLVIDSVRSYTSDFSCSDNPFCFRRVRVVSTLVNGGYSSVNRRRTSFVKTEEMIIINIYYGIYCVKPFVHDRRFLNILSKTERLIYGGVAVFIYVIC